MVVEILAYGSDNGLLPGRRQAIIRTNAQILLIEPLGTNLQWNFIWNSYIFIQENVFENVVCKMATGSSVFLDTQNIFIHDAIKLHHAKLSQMEIEILWLFFSHVT